MKTFYEKYKTITADAIPAGKDTGDHSQNGEWGILNECLKRLGFVPSTGKDRYEAVEFGACDGTYCSNTVDISLTYRGWRRHLYDINPTGHNVEKKEITPDNVNELPDCNILSIDIDGNDYNVWKAYKGNPDIVVIEINSSIDPDAEGPISDPDHGTAFRPMVRLGIEKGYFLLCHTGNLIFIRNDHRHLFPEILHDGIWNREEYFQTKWLSK